MAIADEVKTQLRRFERVEWLYDGLNGKIIPWTKEHGGTSDDPSAQAFVLHHDGSVLARAPDGSLRAQGQFARWLDEQANAYEKTYPSTRVPFLRAKLVRDGEEVRCPALDEARAGSKPVMLYFGRSEREGLERKLRAEVKASKKLEKGTLSSKKAAEAAAEGWALFRFDLGEGDAAAFAAQWGVEKAPALLLWPADAEAPEVLASRLTGASLAYRLKKHS